MNIMQRGYWRTEVNKLMAWGRAHPFKFAIFSALFVFCGALWEVTDWRFAGAVTVGSYILCQLTIWYDLKRVALLVAAALLIGQTVDAAEPPPPPQAEHPALVIAGAFVLVIAGIAGCRIKKRCERIPRARTNAWPEELKFQVAGEPGEYGAAFTWAESGYCHVERLTEPRVPVVFTMAISVESETNVTTTMRAERGEQFTQTEGELREELAEHGLELASAVGSTESFARNRHPVPPEAVPITFDWLTKTINLGAGGVLVTVESSSDLQSWSPLIQFNVEPGAQLEVPDVSDSGAQFYRVVLQKEGV